MDIQWRLMVCRLCVWVAAEIVFSLLGIDDLADYSEFLWQKAPPMTVQELIIE